MRTLWISVRLGISGFSIFDLRFWNQSDHEMTLAATVLRLGAIRSSKTTRIKHGRRVERKGKFTRHKAQLRRGEAIDRILPIFL